MDNPMTDRIQRFRELRVTETVKHRGQRTVMVGEVTRLIQQQRPVGAHDAQPAVRLADSVNRDRALPNLFTSDVVTSGFEAGGTGVDGQDRGCCNVVCH